MATTSIYGLLAIALLFGAAPPTLAQSTPYPNRPIKLVVGFTPGGGVDINARLLASKMSELLGQPVVVENKPGAGTNIANAHVARAAPDGYTLLFGSPVVTINTSLYKEPNYDALRDFVGVSIFSESSNFLVVPATLRVKSVDELVALARQRPGTLNYSSAGIGTTQHLVGELFKLRTGTDIVHVAYKGSGPSLAALLAGEVQLSFANPQAIGQYVSSGRLRALAVASAKRTDSMPGVPTMKEAGIEGVDIRVWYGVLAPAATPRDVVQALANAVTRSAHAPEIRKRLEEQGAQAVGSTPEEFDTILHEEVAKYAEVVRVSGARVE